MRSVHNMQSDRLRSSVLIKILKSTTKEHMVSGANYAFRQTQASSWCPFCTHFARKSAPDPSQGRRSCRFHKVLEPQNLQHPDWVGHPHPADLRHKNGEHACWSWLKMKDRFWWRCWFWFKQQNFNKSAQLGVHSSGQICNPCTSKLRTEMLCHGFSEDHAFIHSTLLANPSPD